MLHDVFSHQAYAILIDGNYFGHNTSMSGLIIKAFRKKTAGLHVALRGNICSPVQVTDLVEVSKDAASLVVCTHKKYFLLEGCGFLLVTS